MKLNPVACKTCSVISDPATSGATLADAEATGTIRNTGAIPQAWIARFGRAVSQHELVFGWSFNLTASAGGPGSVTVTVWRPGAFGLPEHAAGQRLRPELLEQLVTDGRHAPGTPKKTRQLFPNAGMDAIDVGAAWYHLDEREASCDRQNLDFNHR